MIGKSRELVQALRRIGKWGKKRNSPNSKGKLRRARAAVLREVVAWFQGNSVVHIWPYSLCPICQEKVKNAVAVADHILQAHLYLVGTSAEVAETLKRAAVIADTARAFKDNPYENMTVGTINQAGPCQTAKFTIP